MIGIISRIQKGFILLESIISDLFTDIGSFTLVRTPFWIKSIFKSIDNLVTIIRFIKHA